MGLRVEWPKTSDAFDKAIASCDVAMSIGMGVPNLMGLTQQQHVGSYALGDVQQGNFFRTLYVRALRITECYNENLFKELAWWNFGLKNPPKYIPLPQTEEEKRLIVDAWNKAVQAGTATTDINTENHVRTLLGFPAKEEDEAPTEDEGLPPTLPDSASLDIGGDLGNDSENVDKEIEQDIDKKIAQFVEAEDAPRWIKRTDFKEIDIGARNLEQKLASRLADETLDITEDLKEQVRAQFKAGILDDGAVEAIRVKPGQATRIRREITGVLQKAWNQGKTEAKKEIQKAKKAQFAESPLIPAPGMDDQKAQRFLKSRGFTATKKLTSDILDKFQQVLFNALKYDWNLRETMEALDDAIGEFIPTKDSLGRIVNMGHRLETIARTTTLEAINEARANVFTDPELEGYVEGYEYSAILDDRTTPFCEEHNGFKARINDPVWEEIRPPNHFNCRSILVALTMDDDWKESEKKPKFNPAQGFGKSEGISYVPEY
jgi:SPP1 gp7 family putative phage head morphogenesis protein